MLLMGLQKLTLLDFPGKIACTVFTGGCDFRCPFCHNASLVRLHADAPRLPEEEFFKFLNMRKGVLQGVCLTGGEPTLQPKLADFTKRIRELGFKVKLDTNGNNPEVYSRITGYYRPIQNWNDGKSQEYKDRKVYDPGKFDAATGIEGEPGNYTVKGESGEYKAKAVIIATGSKHRQLGLDRENDFVGEGVSYCAVCDGAFYRDKTVAIVGGGNTALQEVVMLSDLCEKVYVLQNLDFLTGETKLQKDIEARENVTVILSTVVTEILGEKEFEGIKINTLGNEKTLNIDGMFIAIGQQPENEPFQSAVKLNDYGYIVSNEECVPENAESGIYVAGDCRTKAIRQVATAVSDGAVAALSACRFIGQL